MSATPSKPARFTAVEYLGLLAAVTNLATDLEGEEDKPWMVRDLAAADRALAKVRATLTPAQHREVSRRLSPAS